LGRNANSSSAGGHYLENVGVRGYWSEAAIYSIASEDVCFNAIDVQLFGGGGLYGYYTSQEDDLNVDNLGGSSNSNVKMINFLIANEVDDVNAASIYIQGGASVINHLFQGGWIGSYTGAYVQINAGGTSIGNLAGPVEFNMINGESGNPSATPMVGFDLTVSAGEGETDFNYLTIKNVNLEVDPAGYLIRAATGADFSKLVRGYFHDTQGKNMDLHSARASYFETAGSIVFNGDVFGCDIYGIETTIGKSVIITGASSGNRIFDATSRGQLTPIKGWFGSSGATANGASNVILESNASQYIQMLATTSNIQGLLCGDTRGNGRGALLYDHAKDGWQINAAGFTVYLYLTNATPEAAIAAPPGSLALNTSGGAGTTLYVKESGTGNTGWVGK
jgi:hypothetical protein